MTDETIDPAKLHWADVRVNVRIYFEDDGETDLMTQAVDDVEDAGYIPDEPGYCEHNGTEVLRVEKARP